MTEITLTYQYQTRQPGWTHGLKYCSVRQRSYFHFRSDEVIHMPGVKHRCQTLGIVQLPDKGMKLVGLIWSTPFFIFSKHQVLCKYSGCHGNMVHLFSSVISHHNWLGFFFRTLPNFKTLVAEATSLFRGKWLALPICAKARALLWRPACYGKGGGVREAEKISKEAGGEEGSMLRSGCGMATHTFMWGRWDGLWVGGSRLSTMS